jgi:hypothetical protein
MKLKLTVSSAFVHETGRPGRSRDVRSLGAGLKRRTGRQTEANNLMRTYAFFLSIEILIRGALP